MNLETGKIKNVGLAGHSGAGKTTLSEAMLYTAGITSRMGTVQDGNTVSDYRADEIDRKMSIHATVMSFGLSDTFYNLIDMPGYADFMGEVKGPMRVCDMMLFAVDAVDGLQIGTERSWKFADEYNLPRWICINGLDRENSDFNTQFETLRNRWGNHIAPFQIPVDQGINFTSVIDILLNKKLTWEIGGKGSFTISDIPADLADDAESYRQELIETIAESDDDLIEKYLEEGTLSEEEIHTGLANAITTGKIYPVVCSSAAHNVGVKRIMELIAEYAPAPDTTKEIEGIDGTTRKLISTEPTSAFVFKTIEEQHVGDLSYFRVYSGTINSGSDIKNVNQSSNERLNQLFLINGKTRTNTDSLPAGSIAAAVKLKNTHTNDTLCNPKKLFQLPPTQYPTPCIRFAMAPASKDDEDKFSRALSAMHEEDPTFTYKADIETNQTIVYGMGEMHIITNMDRMRDRYKLEVVLSEPKVPYRETIRNIGGAKYRHKKQTGGAGQFAEVWMRVEPLSRGSGINFTESLVGQNVDRGFVPSVEKGVNAVCNTGVIAGCKVVDLKVNFYDGKMHAVDSNDMAFQIAGRGAFKESFGAAQPYLLEPIYNVEVHAPEQYMGDVMGDISSRRGQVQGIDSDGHFQIIKAQIPLANLHKYSTTLRSLTHGTSEHTEQFSHYEEMPGNMSQKVVEEFEVARKAGEKSLV